MAGIKIAAGTAASSEAVVDTTGALLTKTTTDHDLAGFVNLATENDDGTVMGDRYTRSLESSEDYRLRVGIDQTLFNMDFSGTNVATAQFVQSLSTMTVAQASGFLGLNSGNATASGNYAILTTRRSFPLFGTYQTYGEMWVREANHTATNAVSEFGFGYAATTSTPTDGVFLRRLSGGQLRAVVNFGGSETVADITETNIPPRDGAGSFSPTENYHVVISIHNDEAEFWINDTRVANIKTPSTQPMPTSAQSQPIFARVYNSGVASAGRRVEIGFINVSLGDMFTGKPYAHALCGGGGGAYQTQPGQAAGPTVSRAAATNGYPASTTAKTSGTWTATSAPANNELGGRWLSPAISTLTSDADYPVFAYLNPAGSATNPGRTLYITGLRIGETIAQAAASTNGIMLVYATAVGSSAAATSTADSATAVAPRVLVLGSCYFTSAAAVGETKAGFEVNFDSPLVVPAGCYWHFIVRPVGTVASNTLTVHGSVLVNGYFE